MLFNSFDFLLFFIAFFSLYWLIPSKAVTWRNALILVASYVFYGYWDWRFLGLIITSTLVDFIAAQRIEKASSIKVRRWWLAISILVNLGMLFYFKYFNFFVEGFADLLCLFGLKANIYTLQIILPIGISFYTFQTMSYTIDVYRNKIRPTTNLLRFAVFVAFFPQLVAGPIERASNLLPQFSSGKTFNYNKAVYGGMLMAYGFFKKIAVADNLAYFVDPVFTQPELYFNWQVILAFIGFGLQIYADFSGYSDIAIGLAAVFGFHLNTNFSTPYFSKSIREFWTRWHISLYTWFRDYVYISLGGNRVSKARSWMNVLVTFGLSGLWHGAGFNYLVFGLMHGGAYAAEKGYKKHLPKIAVRILALLVVILAWGVFRSPDYHTTSVLYSNLINTSSLPSLGLNRLALITVITLFGFSLVEFNVRRDENFSSWISKQKRLSKIAVLYLIIGWTLVFGAFDAGQNFIYFQF